MSNPDQSPASAEPMFWVRLRSDGGYEGPIHNDAIERVRKESGGWTPLYPHVAPTEAAAMAETVPAGWQLVPVEPTRAILDAAVAIAEKHLLGDWSNTECVGDQERADKSNRDYWQAMLAAAPQAPVAGQPAEPSPAVPVPVPVAARSKHRAHDDWTYMDWDADVESVVKLQEEQRWFAVERLYAPKGDSNG